MFTKEQQKALAVKNLETLKIYKPYINKFKTKAGTVTEFENFGGFYVEAGNELDLKIKEVEAEYGCLVYAVVHSYSVIGELYHMLCIGNYDEAEEEDYKVYLEDNMAYVFTYTWNKTDPQCSEFGDLAVRSFGGGIKQIH